MLYGLTLSLHQFVLWFSSVLGGIESSAPQSIQTHCSLDSPNDNLPSQNGQRVLSFGGVLMYGRFIPNNNPCLNPSLKASNGSTPCPLGLSMASHHAIYTDSNFMSDGFFIIPPPRSFNLSTTISTIVISALVGAYTYVFRAGVPGFYIIFKKVFVMLP